MTTDADMLPVPGADLHYQVRGNGPMLLISQSGEGDADRSEDLVRLLESNFTVVTYDRRGLSRSTIHGRPGASIATHADDVSRLLSHLSGEPAAMLGCSMGAAIGLHVAVSDPDRLTTLIAHEPVSPWLLPSEDRAGHLRELEDCQRIFRRQGWRAALGPMVRALGIDPTNQEVEPGVRLSPITPQRETNFNYFLEHDINAVRQDRLDLDELCHSPVRIVPATGRTTPGHVFDHQCAEHLALMRTVSMVTFPGGHNGNLTHPREYATVLHAALSSGTMTPEATSIR